MIAINIEMPKSCEESPIPYITDDMELQCPFQKLYVTGLGKRAEGCPLEEFNELKMREATKEERKSISNYMKNVGAKTGIKFDIYKKEKMGG